jgi:hypothetical protein
MRIDHQHHNHGSHVERTRDCSGSIYYLRCYSVPIWLAAHHYQHCAKEKICQEQLSSATTGIKYHEFFELNFLGHGTVCRPLVTVALNTCQSETFKLYCAGFPAPATRNWLRFLQCFCLVPKPLLSAEHLI